MTGARKRKVAFPKVAFPAAALPAGLTAFRLTTPEEADQWSILLAERIDAHWGPVTAGDLVFVSPDAAGCYFAAEGDGVRLVGTLHGYYRGDKAAIPDDPARDDLAGKADK